MTVDLEIICVGNELLIGKVKDSNSHYLAKQATKLGAIVKRVTIIQDTISEISCAVCEAIARKPKLIVITGGLGPTFDDKTLQGIAKAFNRKLEVNSKALEMVKKKFLEYSKERQLSKEIELTSPRVKMATLPQNTEVVNNPVGTAPGVRVEVQGTILFALPGVPLEMEAIFNETIAPVIKQAVGSNVFCERSIFVDSTMESCLVPLIDKVMSDNEGVYVKSHPIHTESKPHLELHLTIVARQERKPVEKLAKATKELINLIKADGGSVIFELKG